MKLENDLKYEVALERLQEIVTLIEHNESKNHDLAYKGKEEKATVELCR